MSTTRTASGAPRGCTLNELLAILGIMALLALIVGWLVMRMLPSPSSRESEQSDHGTQQSR